VRADLPVQHARPEPEVDRAVHPHPTAADRGHDLGDRRGAVPEHLHDGEHIRGPPLAGGKQRGATSGYWRNRRG